MKLVSVVMCTYNGENFLKEQLESIVSQTYNNIEIIICDDNSTDSTISILQKYAQNDGRIKVFKNETTRNQLIYEKCGPRKEFNKPSINSPMHWGQKYEPVSILYYEKIYKTKISDFGLIPHNKYSFLAASPDGINTDKNNYLFGRMLEIKNVVSREISGIPKSEYWIQMQLQMEVCELNECDFLETKFIEYLS